MDYKFQSLTLGLVQNQNHNLLSIYLLEGGVEVKSQLKIFRYGSIFTLKFTTQQNQIFIKANFGLNINLIYFFYYLVPLEWFVSYYSMTMQKLLVLSTHHLNSNRICQSNKVDHSLQLKIYDLVMLFIKLYLLLFYQKVAFIIVVLLKIPCLHLGCQLGISIFIQAIFLTDCTQIVQGLGLVSILKFTFLKILLFK